MAVPPVTGRVDADGRLIAADAALLALQLEAGAQLGGRLALPQIAAVARLARDLGVPVARPAIAAGKHHDYDLWVRATPANEGVDLAIEGWKQRAIPGPRLERLVPTTEEPVPAPKPANHWTANAQLMLTAISPDLAERLGIDPAEALGQPITRVARLEEAGDGSLPILDALAARTGFSGQRATPRGGGPALILSADILSDAQGAFAGFVGDAVPEPPSLALVGDEGASAPDLGRDLNRALRSPLDQIIASADKIVERADGPLRGDYAAYANDIAAAGRHLLSVLQNMGEGHAAAPERVDLVAAASEAVALAAGAGDGKRVAVDLMASGRVEAQGDKRSIVQILVNIIGNAIRHSPPDGTVTIAIAAQAGRALATVADQGPGIAPEDQQRIFDRFERLGETAPGSGLGLAIALRLAQEMDGAIHLQSARGEGARFTLDLPLA